MDVIFLSKLCINKNDPRQNNEFLWLSYNIHNIKAGQHERTYWMTLEKRCLSLFQDNGYDLQTGAWYCMITTQLYSWDGVANSSWKFAECFFKEKNCWPPATANKMRAQILDWYIKQVIPVISLLPKDGQTFSSLCLLEDALTLLSEIENTLFL
ncbi:TPA: type VI secretion system ImpA family N-terminal domain-containing protein, partial [Escherichia coli]|nr:type VI secretion system ImpA family N-terminal domain-containing protein [Escherichia coli]